MVLNLDLFRRELKGRLKEREAVQQLENIESSIMDVDTAQNILVDLLITKNDRDEYIQEVWKRIQGLETQEQGIEAIENVAEEVASRLFGERFVGERTDELKDGDRPPDYLDAREQEIWKGFGKVYTETEDAPGDATQREIVEFCQGVADRLKKDHVALCLNAELALAEGGERIRQKIADLKKLYTSSILSFNVGLAKENAPSLKASHIDFKGRVKKVRERLSDIKGDLEKQKASLGNIFKRLYDFVTKKGPLRNRFMKEVERAIAELDEGIVDKVYKKNQARVTAFEKRVSNIEGRVAESKINR